MQYGAMRQGLRQLGAFLGKGLGVFSRRLSNRYAVFLSAVFALLILLLVVMVGALVFDTASRLRGEVAELMLKAEVYFCRDALQHNATYLGERLYPAIKAGDPQRLEVEIRQIRDWIRPHSIQVMDADGQLLLHLGESAVPQSLAPPAGLAAGVPTITREAQGYLLYFAIAADGDWAGYARLHLTGERRAQLMQDIEQGVRAHWQGFFVALVFLGLVGLILVVAIGLLFSRHMARSLSRPLYAMTQAAEHYARGNLTYMLPRVSGSHVEIARLSNALRLMASNIREAEAEILRQAHFDALTGLPNRFLSMDRLSKLLSGARRHRQQVGVMFLDLDDFKKVNDTLGHEQGDHLLVEAAARLSRSIRATDTAGRLGGDEFLILMGDLNSPDDTRQVITQILEEFRRPFSLPQGRKLNMTVSIGVATYPDDGADATELLRNADLALYAAKDAGRNTYSFFTADMNRQVSRRLLLEEKLHSALDNGEIYLAYQPEVAIDSGAIIGVEALMRWRNPQLGEVRPDEFIPLAERTGMIVPLGQYVLREALAQLAGWRRLQPGFRLSINLSPRQFRDSHLLDFMRQLLEQNQVASRGIKLEITEGVLLNGYGDGLQMLTSMDAMGFSVAMDDFGTGYSSLSYLRSYPFDVLKIDKSFVNDITTDPKDRELISAVVAMAHSLKLDVVAEGIETGEQLAFLRKLGCDYGQGYLFGAPQAPQHITKLLEEDCTATV